MNSHDNLKLMVRHFPGGLDVVALRLGKKATTLEKELRGAEGFKLGVNDAEAISDLCIETGSPHCHAYVSGLALRAGAFVQLEVREMAPVSLQECVASVVKEASDVLVVSTQRLADGGVSDNDRKAIDKEISELLEKVQQVQKAMHTANKAGKRGRA